MSETKTWIEDIRDHLERGFTEEQVATLFGISLEDVRSLKESNFDE